jgi:hypothetical protein
LFYYHYHNTKHNNNNFSNLIFTLDPHHLENETSALNGFNKNLRPDHGFQSDPPGKMVMTTMMMVVRKGKVDDTDEDDGTKPTLCPESPVLTPLDCLAKLVPPRYASE